jgi:phosphohistidine phosphatase
MAKTLQAGSALATKFDPKHLDFPGFLEALFVTELYLLRHGIAVDPGSSGMPDDARPLTEKGIKRMRQIAAGLLALDLELDRIVTSPLPRAKETAEIVALALGARERLETANVLQTGSDAATVERWLRDRSEERMMLVGHNPTLSELVSLLVVGARMSPICELKKGGIAALVKRGGPTGLFELSWVATPRLLRRLGGALSDD